MKMKDMVSMSHYIIDDAFENLCNAINKNEKYSIMLMYNDILYGIIGAYKAIGLISTYERDYICRAIRQVESLYQSPDAK